MELGLDTDYKNLHNGTSAHIAQQEEHVLGKNGVTSSNLVVGLNKGGKNGKEEI